MCFVLALVSFWRNCCGVITARYTPLVPTAYTRYAAAGSLPKGFGMTLAQFRRDGFAVVRDLINHESLDHLVADIGGVFGRRVRSLGLDFPDPLDHQSLSTLLTRLFSHDRQAYIAAARQTQHLASVHRLGLGPELMRIVTELGLAVPRRYVLVNCIPMVARLDRHFAAPGWCRSSAVERDGRSSFMNVK